MSSDKTVKEARTIQVKIGQQSAREMTPDQAAEYLTCMAAASSSKPLRTDRVAFTFGSRKRGDGDNKSGFWKISAEAKEIAANSINAAVTRSGTTRNNASSSNNGSNSNNNNNSSIPCTEKEMKALMSMFVEIMGLQMNTEKLNSAARKNRRKDLFRFPEDIPPPPGGWPTDLMWPSKKDLEESSSEDDDGADDDSLPDLEDIPLDARQKRNGIDGSNDPKSDSSKERLTTYGSQPPRDFVAGIAVPEWEALERLAMEDALEQEERARKAASAASASGKKSKLAAQRPAVQPITETAESQRSCKEKQRQQGKALTKWRQNVVSACQSNDRVFLEDLLSKSPAISPPISGDVSEDSMDSHYQQCMMDLAAQSLPKNRHSIDKGRECRSLILQHVLKSAASHVVMTPQRNGRSVFHTSCFYGDEEFVQTIVENASAFDNLAKTCEESGWTALHYAVVSGSSRTIQLLVKKDGITLKDKTTNDTHTWETSSGTGLSVPHLINCLLKQSIGKISGMETHGMALAEIQKDMMGSKGSRARYTQWLAQVLSHLEDESFVSASDEKLKEIDNLLNEEEISKMEADDETANNTEKSDNTGRSTKKKKKKKKKAKPDEDSLDKDESPPQEIAEPASRTPVVSQDPLVELLKGMGFEEGPVIDGIQACGGADRATADLVIAWIFERNQSEQPLRSAPSEVEMEHEAVAETARPHKRTKPQRSIPIAPASTKVHPKQEALKAGEEERRVIERLAAKREERRQRNREWNKKQEAQRGVQPATPSTFPQQQAPPIQNGPASLSGRTVEFSVLEASTSLGDYAKDDDLTVSTIGSRTTSTQPPPVMPAPVAASPSPAYNPSPSLVQHTPPGFGSIGMTHSASNVPAAVNEIAEIHEPWHSSDPIQQYQGDVTAIGASFVPAGINNHLYSGLPPGIPETHPVVEERVRAPYDATSFGIGSSSGYGAGSSSVLGGQSAGLHVNSARMLGPSAGIGVPGDLDGYPHPYMPTRDSFHAAGMLHQNDMPLNGYSMNTSGFSRGEGLFSPSHPDTSYMSVPPGRPQVAPLSSSGFGFSSRVVESSMIESISTGTGEIGGSSLWGTSDVLADGASEAKSSLLSHLINDAQDSRSRNETSLFGHNNSNEKTRQNPHTIW